MYGDAELERRWQFLEIEVLQLLVVLEPLLLEVLAVEGKVDSRAIFFTAVCASSRVVRVIDRELPIIPYTQIRIMFKPLLIFRFMLCVCYLDALAVDVEAVTFQERARLGIGRVSASFGAVFNLPA